MTTFSQLVDKMILETKRPDLVLDIQSYVNQTLRELHFHPETNGSILYGDNMIELSLVADSETGFAWTIPQPTRFQAMQAVRYDDIFDPENNPIYVQQRIPGRAIAGLDRFYYRAGGYFTFAGYGGIGASISLAYFEFVPAHKYKTPALREAQFDIETGWTYLDAVTDEEKAIAEALVTNWLLLRWESVVEEGVKAKVYKRVGDEIRGRTSYSLYNQLRKGLYTSEVATPDGSY